VSTSTISGATASYVQNITGNGPYAYCNILCNELLWGSALTPSLNYAGSNAFTISVGGNLILESVSELFVYSSGSTVELQTTSSYDIDLLAGGNVAVLNSGTRTFEFRANSVIDFHNATLVTGLTDSNSRLPVVVNGVNRWIPLYKVIGT
jgi:hypothetical protein